MLNIALYITFVDLGDRKMTTLAELQELKKESTADLNVKMGFDTVAGFALMQRGAMILSNSTIVPTTYRSTIQNKKTKELGR